MSHASNTWEYHIEPMESANEPTLAALGQQRWELVAVVPGRSAPHWVFKRPAPDFRAQVTFDQRTQAFADAGITGDAS